KLFGPGITLERISDLAKNNNSKAMDFWVRVGSHLGLALAGVVNLLNLDAIIIGGGVSDAGKVLFESVKQTISRRAMSVQAKRIRVLKARLGNHAGIIGAGYLVKERLAG
ncbi:MAG: ROK family protein, partial [Candidatus Omnitrophota bacterium]|nr:ROK family protein [Candidatus Omnitrophota bacterium]